MKVYEISNYLNESLILDIKSENNKKFVDEFHVVESNATYRYNKKKFNLKKKYSHIFHHKIDGLNLFYKPFPRLTRAFPFVDFNKYSWLNERVQRDYLLDKLKKKINDDDIIIISDLDEIINFNFFDKIKFFVKKKDIITFQFHQTMYYFNLFNNSKNGGPDNWAYRTFVMNGKYFKKIKSIEKLRIEGAANKLLNEVYCEKKIMGFHHSWILSNNLLYKLKNYSHTISEHLAIKKKLNEKIIEDIVNSKQNISSGTHLNINSEIKLLRTVENKRKKLPHLFL